MQRNLGQTYVPESVVSTSFYGDRHGPTLKYSKLFQIMYIIHPVRGNKLLQYIPLPPDAA